jgi:NAD+ synthase (glutamine-hydrolysing)
MRIAIAQLNQTIGALSQNTAKVKDYITRAAENKSGLVIFSELVLSGYPPKDLLLYNSFIERERELLEKEILPLTLNGPAVIIGSSHFQDGILYNAALFLEEGVIKTAHRKSLLPNYDVFDEERYFSPGQKRSVEMVGGLPTAITVCEDIWNDSDYNEKPLYSTDPLVDLFTGGAHLLINISASPYHLGKQKLREDLLAFLAGKYSTGVIYVNQVGGNDELIFDGSSLVYNNRGELLHRAASFAEDLFFIESEDLHKVAFKTCPPAEEKIAAVLEALILGLRDYIAKTGFSKAVLGLSGGVDSALVAALAVKALGAENVLGLIMPSPYSSEHSVKDALALADNLGMERRIIEINEPFAAYLGLLNKGGKAELDLAEENLQARIRGNLVMHISNREGYLALATGNKSELAVGYCTLYGDMAGGLAVIADLPKMMVYELANHINKVSEKEIIPQNTIAKAPSAELRPDQKDEDSLPPYSLLDPILQLYIEENLSITEICKRGYDQEIVEKIVKMVDRAEFKRRQAAPGLRITTRAFGSGRRMPIARSYEY